MLQINSTTTKQKFYLLCTSKSNMLTGRIEVLLCQLDTTIVNVYPLMLHFCHFGCTLSQNSECKHWENNMLWFDCILQGEKRRENIYNGAFRRGVGVLGGGF